MAQIRVANRWVRRRKTVKRQDLGLLICMVFWVGRVSVCPAQVLKPGAPRPNPYEDIVYRNAFGLKPLPPPKPAQPEKPPPPKVTLTGITTILGTKTVLMKVQAVGPTNKPESFILAQGEHKGPIEVVSVNVKTGDVTLKDDGTLMTLNLERDGAKLGPSSAPTAANANGRIPPSRRFGGWPVTQGSTAKPRASTGWPPSFLWPRYPPKSSGR